MSTLIIITRRMWFRLPGPPPAFSVQHWKAGNGPGNEANSLGCSNASLLTCSYINCGTTRALLESVQLHLSQHFSLHKNKLLVPQGNQLLPHSWKTPSTLPLWRLHTLVNVLLVLYSALQVSCLAGVLNQQLSMSLYKLIAFVLCTTTELSHCLFTLSSGQLSCKALYSKKMLKTWQFHIISESFLYDVLWHLP